MMANSLILTDIHPVLSEVTKFGTFEDNLNLKCAWGRYAFANKSELNDVSIWKYCLRVSYRREKKKIKDLLENFVEKKFYRHIEKGPCCVAHCNEDRTYLINMTSLFQNESSKMKRVYRTLYCSAHYKDNRNLY